MTQLNLKIKKGVLIITVNIEGHHLDFLLDTGSELSYIAPLHYYRKFKIKLDDTLRVKGIGKDSIVRNGYHFQKFTIGDTIMDNFVFIEKKRTILFKLLDIQGVIGWNILQQFDFQVDLRTNKLSFVKECIENNIVFMSKGDIKLPIYEMKVNGIQDGSFLVDTGSNYSYLYENTYIENAIEKKSFSIGINGIEISKLFLYKNFTFSSVNEKAEEITIDNIYVENFPESVTAILGINVFREKKLIFLNSQQKLYIL